MCNFGGPFAYPLWNAGDDCDKAGHGPTPLSGNAAHTPSKGRRAIVIIPRHRGLDKQKPCAG